MVATKTNAARDPRLDGLRGFCALGVLIYHVAYQAGVSNHIDTSGDGIWGYITTGLGVALPPFFVLSGLMLYRPFARSVLRGTKPPQVKSFLWGRSLRILPGFWVLVTVCLLLLNFNSIHNPWDALKPYLLLHFLATPNFNNWLIGLDPTWTVPAEMFFYLSLPVMCWAINRYARKAADPAARVRRMMWSLLVPFAVGLGWTIFTYSPADIANVWYFAWWPLGYVGFFAAGMGLATLQVYQEEFPARPHRFRNFVARHPNLFWLAAVGVFIANVPTPLGNVGDGSWGGFWQELLTYSLLFLFAIFAVTPLTVARGSSRTMNAILSNPPMRYLGRICFSIYLWHVFYIDIFIHDGSIFGTNAIAVNPSSVHFWPLLGFVLGLTLVTATVSHYLIEQPALKLRTKFFVPTRQIATAPAAPALPPQPAARPEAVVPEGSDIN